MTDRKKYPNLNEVGCESKISASKLTSQKNQEKTLPKC